jgi:hypothetical protein
MNQRNAIIMAKTRSWRNIESGMAKARKRMKIAKIIINGGAGVASLAKSVISWQQPETAFIQRWRKPWPWRKSGWQSGVTALAAWPYNMCGENGYQK